MKVDYPQLMKAIAWFNEIGKNDINIVGGKGANLGEMTQAGFPVPPGFIVTAQTYFDYTRRTGIQSRIIEEVNKVDVNDTIALHATSRRIGEIMVSVPMLPDIRESIIEAYQVMSQ